ncbi:MAG: hypothetical protein IJN43_07705 [Ruminococcus sp.]|nr:hypothetical protein [Ruminococcus sp.]
MFNKRIWVIERLKSGFDKGIWSAEHIMENAMKYSMAGILNDNDLAELKAYTTPVIKKYTPEATEETSATETVAE